MTFGALVARRRRPARLVGLLLVGYLAVWAGFGFSAWIADRIVHATVEAIPWLAAQPQLILGATLLGAGLWQFSPLRDRCLDECRSPLGFVVNRWRGISERREALQMGVAHGAFCVGCCWSLMLVMCGVGVSRLVLRLRLGGGTAIELGGTANGYRAVLEAARLYGRFFPMMMTSAGSAKPARVVVLGAGVAVGQHAHPDRPLEGQMLQHRHPRPRHDAEGAEVAQLLRIAVGDAADRALRPGRRL